MLFYSIALLTALIDQITKYFVHKHLLLGQSIPLVGNIVKLTYVRNTGAAFSFFVGFSSYLAVIGLVVAVAVVYFHYRLPSKDRFLQVALAFILGGSLGNLFDRIFRSYVIDYLDITIWPVFNFADIIINIGVIMLIFKFVSKEEQDVSNPV